MDSSQNTSSSKPSVQYRTSLAPDGDVILYLQGTKRPQEVLYRVDKLILSRHSPVFAGLFSIPYDSSVNEEYDGVPVVRLDDDAEDMSSFLNFLYDPSSLVLEKASPDTPLDVMGVLKVAQKYQVDAVRRLVVRQLQSDWPTNLREWILHYGELSQLRQVHSAGSSLFEDMYADNLFAEPAAAIRLAIDYNIPSILPSAFYALAGIELEHDRDTFHGSEAKAAAVDVDENPIYNMERTARWNLLDKDTLYYVLLGRNKLRKRQLEFAVTLCLRPSCHAEGCTERLIRFSKHYEESLWASGCRGPLQTLLEAIPRVPQFKLCFSCHSRIIDAIDEEMESIWNALPHMFSFDKMGISFLLDDEADNY